VSNIKSAIVSAYVFFRPGKPVSRKVIASGLASVLVYAASLVAAKHSGHLTETQTDVIAVAAANLAGFGAGWLRSEFPEVVSDGQDLPQSSLTAPALPPDDQPSQPTLTAETSPENVTEHASAASEPQPVATLGPPPPAS